MIELNETSESDDDIITRWEITGLLEDIPDEEKASIAHLLHAATLHLSGDGVEGESASLFITTVRKIYSLNNKCVAIKFKVLELMLESALFWELKNNEKQKMSVWNKIIEFFGKISIVNLSSPSEEISVAISQKIEDDVIEQVSKEYVEKFCMHGNAMSMHDSDCGKLCEHGKGITDYCLPCNRINNA